MSYSVSSPARPDIKIQKELPVSGRSCLSPRVPILQATKHPLQSNHSSFSMDNLDLPCLKMQLARV